MEAGSSSISKGKRSLLGSSREPRHTDHAGDRVRFGGTRPSCGRACEPCRMTFVGTVSTFPESGPRSAVTPLLSAPPAYHRTGRVSLGLGDLGLRHRFPAPSHRTRHPRGKGPLDEARYPIHQDAVDATDEMARPGEPGFGSGARLSLSRPGSPSVDTASAARGCASGLGGYHRPAGLQYWWGVPGGDL